MKETAWQTKDNDTLVKEITMSRVPINWGVLMMELNQTFIRLHESLHNGDKSTFKQRINEWETNCSERCD